MHLLGPETLVLADRGFDNGKLLAQFARTGAQFLASFTIALEAARDQVVAAGVWYSVSMTTGPLAAE
ncbi:hypothetical protein [Streptomyces sp. T21Q-yed]|nr:hypothetical protein [Streptomyces sp. T21Q-yed]MDF3146286.1 hypothetical protein [Streptomyces sp. T21Q-yed]